MCIGQDVRLFFCKIHLRLNDTYSLPSFRFWSALHWNLICWVGAAVCNLYGKVAIATTKWSQHRFFIDSHWTGLFYLILFPYILLVLYGVCVCVLSGLLRFFIFFFSPSRWPFFSFSYYWDRLWRSLCDAETNGFRISSTHTHTHIWNVLIHTQYKMAKWHQLSENVFIIYGTTTFAVVHWYLWVLI